MLSQNQIKNIRSLQQKKFRNELQQFIAEGPKLVDELIESKFLFDCIYAKEAWLSLHRETLENKKITFAEITQKELERISGLTTPNLVVAVINMPNDPLSENIFGKELILVLDNIKDPGNLGAIIRTADWFGINNIICSETSVDAYNPKVIQATMGSVARVNIYYSNLTELLEKHSSKAPIYGAFMDGKKISEVSLEKNGIVVIGNESNGISPDIQPFISQKVAVPMYVNQPKKNPESLNASIAAAIICYEFRKQE